MGDGGASALILAGESAGGGLAMAITRKALADDIPPPRKLLLFSPWVDLTEAGLHANAATTDPTLASADLALFAHAYAANSDRQDPAISPGLGDVPAGWPATFLTSASGDIVQTSVGRLADKLTAAGAPATVVRETGLNHVFELYDEFPEAISSLRRAAAFVGEPICSIPSL